MYSERELLEEYVVSGKLMQVATISAKGEPAVCNVWYCVRFRPDRLYFISRSDREHSGNVRTNGRVAGSIVDIPLEGVGQKVRGVTFKGQAAELRTDAQAEINAFLTRWPQAKSAISTNRNFGKASPVRLYEIRVREWVLFDEVNYPDAPRRIVDGVLG